MKTFLSIDMDFWNGRDCFEETIPDQVYGYLNRLCSDLKNRRIPMSAVMNHQQMLRMVNNSKANTLINIDMHSDLASSEVQVLNCGTWVSYVKWRRQAGHYLWLHRHSAWHGECNLGDDMGGPIFEENSIVRRSMTDWGVIQHRKVKRAPQWAWLKKRNPVEFSLVLSPHYVDRDLEPVFRQIVKDFRLPYIKGIRHEQHARQDVRPPFRDTVRYAHDFAAYDLLPA